MSSSWFVGFTPQLATAVMYVRGDGNGQLDGWLPSYFGGDYPAETWTEVMTRAMEGATIEEFPEPAYVDGETPPSDGPRAVHAAAAAEADQEAAEDADGADRGADRADAADRAADRADRASTDRADCDCLGNCPTDPTEPTDPGDGTGDGGGRWRQRPPERGHPTRPWGRRRA